MSFLTLKELPVASKRVLMRVDFNVPLDQEGRIADDSRIRAALPSIQWVLSQGGSLVLMSHLGRPKGVDPKLSLKPCSDRLSELLGIEVRFVARLEDVGTLKSGEVVLLENLRFNPAEEKPEKDPAFAKTLAALGDVYVDDAFGCAHRAHSSITEVPKYFREAKGAGFLMEREVKFLSELIEHPERPFVALIGGAKLSTKLGVLETLAKKCDKVLIGGAMAFTLLKAEGVRIGASLSEEGAPLPKGHFILPLDFVCEKEGEIRTFSVREGIPDGFKGMDIGPESIKLFKREIQGARTLFWNGPMGVFEDERFFAGTREMAKAIRDLSGTTVAGGGDTLAAIKQTNEKCHLADRITHLSTGGGASLEFLEFGTLPGIEALRRGSLAF